MWTKMLKPFEPELVLIPAGEFLMGSDPNKDKSAQKKEQPQHRLYLPHYYIAKTPVTNAQYTAFVEAADHEPPRHWDARKPPQGKEDHPVVWVSWYDAVAYCKWLAEVTGKAYRLPSEAEWEKAARGADGRIYPWGNEWDAGRCNTREGGKNDTTPVGAYPQGASLYSLLDMAGNVFEWARSLWGPDSLKPKFEYPYNDADGRENPEAGLVTHRVMRGGSWSSYRSHARCACRFRNFPSVRWDGFGFRLVVSPIPPSSAL